MKEYEPQKLKCCFLFSLISMVRHAYSIVMFFKVGFETRNNASIVLKLLFVAHICEPIFNSPVE